MDLQAMDRCHRIGQTRPVHVYRLATAHSVEVWFYEFSYIVILSILFLSRRLIPFILIILLQGRIIKKAFGKLKLEHVVIAKGQFQQDSVKPNTLEVSVISYAFLHQDNWILLLARKLLCSLHDMLANSSMIWITVGPLLAYSNNNQEYCQVWARMCRIYVRPVYIYLGSDVGARFKDLAESETSRIRLGPFRDESESRVGW